MFRRATTRIRQWRVATEREKEFQTPIECWQGCGYVGRFDDLMYHMKLECTHRLLKCPDCKEYVKEYIYKEHRNSQCLMRICGCPNAGAGCVELVRHYEIKRHLKLRCQLRPITCRMNCGGAVSDRILVEFCQESLPAWGWNGMTLKFELLVIVELFGSSGFEEFPNQCRSDDAIARTYG